MTKNTFIYLIPIITMAIILVGCSKLNNDTTSMKDNSTGITFSINIKTFTHGDSLLWDYDLSEKTIKVTQYFVDGKPPMFWADRNLNDTEKEKLEKFLKNFPIRELKEKYIDENFEGEIHSEYKIKINGLEKNIYVYGVKEENLDNLVNLIGTFLEPPSLLPVNPVNDEDDLDDTVDNTIMDDTNMNKKGMEEKLSADATRVAWNSISEKLKSAIGKENSQNPKVSKADWETVQEKIVDDEPPFVYLVTFERKTKTPTGPVGIYVDPTEEKVVGYVSGI